MEFDLLEPIGGPGDDVRMGMIASTIANTNRDPEKRPEPFDPIDFIPWAVAAERDDDAPIELEDDVAQSNLIRAAIFGKRHA
jgi:hypothetical protein